MGIARGANNSVGLRFVLISLLVVVLVLVFSIFFINSNSSPLKFTGYAVSQVGNLSAGITTYVTCNWVSDDLDVSFGSDLSPGAQVNATKNYAGAGDGTMYNISVDLLSNVAVNVTISGNDFVSGANIIKAGNITWASSTASANDGAMIASNGIALTEVANTVNPVASDLAAGETVHYRMWLSVPSGQVAGNYQGNYTTQCQQA
jgi:hypothetical protein